MAQDVVINGTTYPAVETVALTDANGNTTLYYPDAVRYVEQNLTEEQKAQARQNIGIVGTGENGKSPSIELSNFSDSTGSGVNISVRNADGTGSVFPVYHGKNGTSALARVSKTGNVTTITTQDATGTKTAEVYDGITPHIGENGNWYIGETDTGVSSGGNGSPDVLPDNVVTKPDVFEFTNNPLFTNIFDTVEIEYGKLLNTDGTVSDTTAALATTDYIEITKGSVLRMADFAIYNGGSCRVVLYDSDRNKIQHAQTNGIAEGAYYVEQIEEDVNGHKIAVRVNNPDSVKYIRICTNTAVIGENPVLTVDEEIEYEMGYGRNLNRNIRVDFSQVINAPEKNCWSILPYERLNIAYSSIGRKPINTIAHFTDAAENYNYNALKADVRPTSDDELICCHDAGFTLGSDGYLATYDSANSTPIRNVTAATCLGYRFKTGESPCLVGDYLDVCRTYGKVAFITIRNEYMDVVIPKLLEELENHNMTYSAIINCMTYESLVQWREIDQAVMINYTLNFGVAIDQAQIDRAVDLGYCSLCGFSLSSSSVNPSASCDFEYARTNGVRLLQAIAYKEGSPEACYAMGYDGCQIGIPWSPKTSGGTVDTYSREEIDTIMGSYISDIDNLIGGET